MNKIVDFNGIGYVAATFPVDADTITYLTTNHLNAKTGNVDINGKNLAVTLGTDGKVKFGTGSEPVLGIIIAYEMDGFASVQIKGGVDGVPTASTLTSGVKKIAVNSAGAIVANDGGKEITVAKPSTSGSLFASIIL